MAFALGITEKVNLIPWKYRAIGAAISVFQKIVNETESLERIQTFAAIRRDDGTLFFTPTQQQAITHPEKVKIWPGAEVTKKDTRSPLPDIFKIIAGSSFIARPRG